MMHLVADRGLKKQVANPAEDLLPLEGQLPRLSQELIGGIGNRLSCLSCTFLKAGEHFSSCGWRKGLHTRSCELHLLGLNDGRQKIRKFGYVRGKTPQSHRFFMRLPAEPVFGNDLEYAASVLDLLVVMWQQQFVDFHSAAQPIMQGE